MFELGKTLKKYVVSTGYSIRTAAKTLLEARNLVYQITVDDIPVNGYVTVNADGIATACEKSAENAYRVIKSNTDSVVEIIFR